METILLFYKYVYIKDPQAMFDWQQKICTELRLRGRIVLAHEGINATLAGSSESIEAYCTALSSKDLFQHIDFKKSPGSGDDFPRLQIKIKKEITHLGLDPEKITAQDGGKHLSPQEAHALIAQKPDNLVILDGRNNYESRIGAFEGAIKPDITYFREFPHYIDEHAKDFQDKIVLMYCTGGIRCERASAYLKSKNVAQEVYQIEGGIHRYAEQFPEGFFKGKNYVFDGRIATTVTNDIISSCDYCKEPSDSYRNCMNALCNKHFIACDSCNASLQNVCSTTCRELLAAGSVHPRPLKYRNSSCSLR